MAKRAKRGTKPLSKAASQFRHAVRRARERYGIELNKEKYLQLCQMIQTNQGEFLGKQSNRLSVWKLEVQHETALEGERTATCNVVYDKERKRIVTFLPEGITDAKGVSLVDEADED